ncbi:hypothetical protein [Sorangium sp. So ce1000]|uniref:hypothetical protein n=1 Tax=Sorangium sp. So ce1000 TaxID=3133325 RepID=UPI003F63E154
MGEYDESDEYPYWFGGTCFLVRYLNKLYALTAKHVLKNMDPNAIRIPRRPDSRTFLTLTKLWTGKIDDPEDTDYADWAIVAAEEPGEDASGDPIVPPLDLDAITPVSFSRPPEGCKLAIRGYPIGLSRVSYDEQRLKWQAFAGSAMYVAPTSWKHCHTARFDDVSGIDNIDHMSGSPVVLVCPQGSKSVIYFAGLAVRGTKESGLVHFIDAKVIMTALMKVNSERTSQASSP